jgi:hypothetical protein
VVSGTASTPAPPGSRARTVELGDDVDAIEYCYEQGWTDGLPVIPPTPERVAAAVAATGRAPEEIVCTYIERGRQITLEHVSVNAVMAGCKPEYTPVVVALLEAMAKPGRLHSVNATSGGAAVAFVVNGPIRTALGMNSGGNVLGPGNRANSTIGRALRLVQINALGSVPGAGNDARLGVDSRPILDRATMGQPGKYAGYHIVENEDDFPSLKPLHVELGYAPEQSVVTAFGTLGHAQYSVHHEATAQEIVDTLSHYLVHSGRLTRRGGCIAVVIPPENAEIFVRDGWSKANIRQALFDGTKRSLAWVRRNGWTLGAMDRRGAEVLEGDEDQVTSIAGSPDEILVVVAGGPAGGWVHAIFQYAGDLASQEIQLPKEHT